MTSPNELDAVQAAAAIRAGQLTSEQLVQACLNRVDARENVVGAWQHLDREKALQEARARDAAPGKGLLHGVPIAVKDIIDTAELPTGYGSTIYHAAQPSWDASCVNLAGWAEACLESR